VSVRKKAFVYLVRRTRGIPELLVFESHDGQGFEVVKGAVDRRETLVEAAARELREEAGVSGARFVGRLGTTMWNGELQAFCLFEAPDGIPDRFVHTVTGGGIDEGLAYSFRWLPVDDSLRPRLIQGAGGFLAELVTRTARKNVPPAPPTSTPAASTGS
jgi:8-oxo-dGTP pyrophosphatase MutT (NUDIX family)